MTLVYAIIYCLLGFILGTAMGYRVAIYLMMRIGLTITHVRQMHEKAKELILNDDADDL